MEKINAQDKPNILIFMTDQQRGATVLLDSRFKALTPRLDAFREKSCLFNKAYTVSPHCCPSRASFFTGLYPSEHGVWNNVNTPNALSVDLRPGTRLWSEDLKEAGYDLRISGKWHVSALKTPENFGWSTLYPKNGEGAPPPTNPHESRSRSTEKEFAHILSGSAADQEMGRRPGEIRRSNWPEYFHYGVTENPFGDQDVVDAAKSFLAGSGSEAKKDPWCLYVGTLGPHDPYMPPQAFLDLYDADDLPPLPASFYDEMLDKPALYRRTRNRFDQLTEEEHRETIRRYLAFCTYEDFLFGQLLDDLEASGQSDNTVVLFLSDHGDYMGEHGLWCKGLPSFESAYHVPCVIHDPRRSEAREVDGFVSLTDLGPTILELAGVEGASAMSGQSLVHWLKGETPSAWRDALFFQSNGNETYGIQRGIMTEKWKYVYNGFDYDELYDLEDDPDEMVNLLAAGRDERRLGQRADCMSEVPEEYREIVSGLIDRMWEFGYEANDELWNDYIMTALMPKGPDTIIRKLRS